VLGALTVYYILKYNPAKAKQIICSSDEYLKYMPIDKNTSSFHLPYWISPKQKWGESSKARIERFSVRHHRVAPPPEVGHKLRQG
jgi:hypothetical protein